MGASLEAKVVILGSQNVGKTSLVHRIVHSSFLPPTVPSTIGASFLTTRVHDAETDTTIRLQIWDTAGQERFRSISKLYYRGAQAAVLCYDITSARTFDEMGVWLRELRDKTGLHPDNTDDIILHIVGTKSDVVALDPSRREVPFERCIDYVAQTLYAPEQPNNNSSSAPATTTTTRSSSALRVSPPPTVTLMSPTSNRSSVGFWGQEALWDCCHEISAKDGEGIDEVFRVITRKLIEQHHARAERQRLVEESMGRTPGWSNAGNSGTGAPYGASAGQQHLGPGGVAAAGAGYFDHLPGGGNGSFRVGHGDKRRSWLGFPTAPGAPTSHSEEGEDITGFKVGMGGRCC